MRETGPEGHYT